MGNVTNLFQLLNRPRPPSDLISMDGLIATDRFVPAPELTEWIRQAYIADGPLYGIHHAHLEQAFIGCLWTNAQNTRQQRRIVGQAEMPERMNKGGKWQKARSEQQLIEWFGGIPHFLLTFDAVYAADCDDASFCALVDHELCHCAQDVDEFGAPKFKKDTGMPIFTMRGHDVEEFVSVVRRFGIQAAGEAATDLVIAAAQTPEIAPVKIAHACGTCAARKVA
jgi:hypothetical protein